LILAGVIVLGVIIWQGVTASGNPDPTTPHTSTPVAVFDIAALVFREGLECVLVLSALTAGLRGSQEGYRKPIGYGVVVGAVVTLLTWLLAVRIVDDLTGSISALAIQAATGLLAIVVLLIVMNWFFHKIYWTGWIGLHHRRQRSLVKGSTEVGASQARLLLGLGLLGFASFYREGFEVVLFLQSYRLQLGDAVVFWGALIGVFLSGCVAVLTFVSHHRLPYKKMLVVTGVLLAAVLFVMIGEEVFEMQQANWIGTASISWLSWLPDWAGTWLSIFPDAYVIGAQLVGLFLVLGSYAFSRYQAIRLPRKQGLPSYQLRTAPPESMR
jgi:high-affinity iron transporter